MFHHFTVETSTYNLLKNIFSLEDIYNTFALAGGTSLALQIGTRKSIDLDFFSPDPFDTQKVSMLLEDYFGINYEFLNMSKRMLFCVIEGVKCDFVYEPATVIRPIIIEDKIKIYSIPDIAAMKLHTICGRGKKKDFFDIYSLLTRYSWQELVNFFIEKYDTSQLYFLMRSIQYFEDADEDPEITAFPPFVNDWTTIKQNILQKTKL